jgi:hypothetical protein
MANSAAAGTTGKAFIMPIERGKIIEFAAATRSRNPAYWAQERPPVPPTFLTTQMFWQEWAGDTLTCDGTLVRAYEGPDEPLADVELACTRQTGEIAVRAWATFAREN